MKKVINIALDIETLSCRETAAIISLAAVPFDKYGEGEDILKFPFGEETVGFESYYEVVNATSCALAGLHFDNDTVKFWHKQTDDAKAELLSQPPLSIREATEGFVNYIERLKKQLNVDVHIWAQGTDFDLPIIRNAIREVLQIKDIPWKHYQVRDARTWILESIELLFGNIEEPYSVIPVNDTWKKHSALSDAKQLAWNVGHVNMMLRSRISNNQ